MCALCMMEVPEVINGVLSVCWRPRRVVSALGFRNFHCRSFLVTVRRPRRHQNHDNSRSGNQGSDVVAFGRRMVEPFFTRQHVQTMIAKGCEKPVELVENFALPVPP